MTRPENKVDVHPCVHPSPSLRSAGCGGRASLAVPHPQQEGRGVDGWTDYVVVPRPPSTFPGEEYRFLLDGVETGPQALMPDDPSHGVRGQKASRHAGPDRLSRAPGSPLNRTGELGDVMPNPTTFGDRLRLCLHLLEYPGTSTNIPHTFDALAGA